MKKLLAFLLAGMMAFSATACGSGNDSNTPEASQPTNSTGHPGRRDHTRRRHQDPHGHGYRRCQRSVL